MKYGRLKCTGCRKNEEIVILCCTGALPGSLTVLDVSCYFTLDVLIDGRIQQRDRAMTNLKGLARYLRFKTGPSLMNIFSVWDLLEFLPLIGYNAS